MMSYGGMIGGGFGGTLGLLSQIVWLVAGVLLVVWLWKQISK